VALTILLKLVNKYYLSVQFTHRFDGSNLI